MSHEDSDEINRVTPTLPERPNSVTFPAKEENVDNLKQFLIESFNNTVFDTTGSFPAMETIPATIHFKQDTSTSTIPVPYNWKRKLKTI